MSVSAAAGCTIPTRKLCWFGALLILAEVGDVRRFPGEHHFVFYAGLVPSVHSSGGHTRYGRITKQGSSWLRWIFVEAADVASRRPGALRDRYLKLAYRKDAKTARVALARHLAELAYLLLSRAAVYDEHRSQHGSRPAYRPGRLAGPVVA